MTKKLQGAIFGAIFGLVLMVVTMGIGVGLAWLGSIHFSLPLIILAIVAMIAFAVIGFSEGAK